ncbi:MAG: GspH/FimT family pseudopilin [Burkholderiales bacterium]|nr:GspH/FimT family pseudopilin [Burkholderiales bacterium]
MRPDPGRPQRAGRPRGLTLLEVAMVLAVLAVLSTLAVPSVAARLQRGRLQFAAEALAGDLAEARFQAAQRGLTLHLQAQAGADWCWAVTTTPACPCGQAQPCQLQRVTAADHPGVRLVQAMAVRLEPDGSAVARQPALFESAAGQRVAVALSPLGRARLCAPTGAWPTMPAC